MIRCFYIVYAAYNEERNLLGSFLATKKSIEHYRNKHGGRVIARFLICHNGCTDDTPRIAEEIKKEYSCDFLKIDVISSAKGKVRSQAKSIEYIRRREKGAGPPVIFIDADTYPAPASIDKMLEQFAKHPKLKAVGVCPRPLPHRGLNPYRKFLDHFLNCRAYFPMSEIACRYAPEFHPYAETDEQEIGADFEKRSKIYFHGRCFALRGADIWDIPADCTVDDTFLDRSINYRFGPGSIRMLYDVNVYYQPYISFWYFHRVYYRIYRDLNYIRAKYPKFNTCREFSKTKLDWPYIFRLPVYWQAIFILYQVMRRFSHWLYKKDYVLRDVEIEKIWTYNYKT